MPNIPPHPKINQITWFEVHLPRWAADPAAFGLSQGAVDQLAAAVAEARSAYDAAQAARQAAMSATVAENTAVAAMLGRGRAAVNTVKAFIEGSGDLSLWGAAGLEPPATPGGGADPAAPEQLRAALDPTGRLIITWKAAQPRGVSNVVYAVRRSIEGGAFILIDTVGGKRFADGGVPAGTATVAYTIQARRGGRASAWSQALTVRFGGRSAALAA
jgi:hypothetical protein